MTQAELYQALESIGLPITYSHYDADENNPPPHPPYMIYLFSDSDDFMADGVNFKSIDNFQVELYTNKKDLASEKLIQDKLKELELPYYKMETWVDTEKLFQVVYLIQII